MKFHAWAMRRKSSSESEGMPLRSRRRSSLRAQAQRQYKTQRQKKAQPRPSKRQQSQFFRFVPGHIFQFKLVLFWAVFKYMMAIGLRTARNKRKSACSMPKPNNFNYFLMFPHSINNSIGSANYLAQGWLLEFRHNTAAFWKG